LAVGGKKVPCQPKYDGFEACAIFPRLVTAQIFLFPKLKSVLKGQQLACSMKDTAKETRALTVV
jgi:hypothetical protein